MYCPHCRTRGRLELIDDTWHCLICGREFKNDEGEVNKMAKDNWEELKNDAVETLRKFFKVESPDDETIKKVKIATSILSSYTRHEQTESAKEQTAVIVGRELSSNKDEFAEYLRISIPRLNQIKTLEGSKN